MNAAIIAAVMAAQRNTILPRNNHPATQSGHRNDTESVAACLLLQKGEPTTMNIAENETIISTIIHGYHRHHGYEYVATISDQEITAPTVEGCIQKVVEISHAKEIQLLPHAISNGTVHCYLMILKVNK